VTNPNCGSLASVDGQDPDGNVVDLSGVILRLSPSDIYNDQFTMVGKFGTFSCGHTISFKLQFGGGTWTPSGGAMTLEGCVSSGPPGPDYTWTLAIMNGPCHIEALDDQTVRLSFADGYVDFRWE